LKTGAVIVGAGAGVRLGADAPKCFVLVEGTPLLFLSAYAFEESTTISEIILVVPNDRIEETWNYGHALGFRKLSAVRQGGLRRQDSVLAGLNAVSPSCENALVHDGARPLVSVELIDRVVSELRVSLAALPALPVSDTLHHLGEYLTPGPERSGLYAAQTPQGSRIHMLIEALNSSLLQGTTASDEATLLYHHLKVPSTLVDGDSSNIKITVKGDLQFYQPQLRERARKVKGEI